MEFNISVLGDLENPIVELPGRRARAEEIYKESPLFAFLVSIPHCVAVAFESVAKKEGIKVKNCKVRASYELDEKQFMLGYPVIKKIKIYIHNEGCTEEELNEIITKVKRECPIYLSFSEKIDIIPS
ncbi:OsmC family protein [Sulfurisphaera javensis]|uniref:OsmC family protein n=1 Tax=Sulfurisphaera javensis TaxID=2049879 RepID=A0AAT9GV31_9CREN